MKIAIITDSTTAFTPPEIAKYHLHILPIQINYEDGTSFDDTFENAIKYNLHDHILQNDVTTSQTNPTKMRSILQAVLQNYDKAFCLVTARNLSSQQTTLQKVVADHFLNKVYAPVSYLSGNLLQPLLVKMSMLTAQGTTIEHLLHLTEQYEKSSMTFISPGDLNKLKKSGRAAGVVGRVLSLLKVRLGMAWGRTPHKILITRSYKKIITHFLKVYQDFSHKHNDQKFSINLHFSEQIKSEIKKSILDLFAEAKVSYYKVLHFAAGVLVHSGYETFAFTIFPSEYEW